MKRFTRDLNARALCPSRAIVLLSFVFCVFFPRFFLIRWTVFSFFLFTRFIFLSSGRVWIFIGWRPQLADAKAAATTTTLLKFKTSWMIVFSSPSILLWIFFFFRGLGSCWCAFRPTRYFFFPATYKKKYFLFSLLFYLFFQNKNSQLRVIVVVKVYRVICLFSLVCRLNSTKNPVLFCFVFRQQQNWKVDDDFPRIVACYLTIILSYFSVLFTISWWSLHSPCLH